LAERDTIESVKARQGIVSKLQNLLLGGFATKEDLRELDKQMRDAQYHTLRDMRHTWEGVYLAVLDADTQLSQRDLKRVLQTLDRVMAKIRRADYGYAGLWDRKGQINEKELARVFDFDKALSQDIAGLEGAVQKTQHDVEEENWTDARDDLKQVGKLLRSLEDKWNERETLFRPLM
jgi:predicted helicase